jgi:hypothetical protein
MGGEKLRIDRTAGSRPLSPMRAFATYGTDEEFIEFLLRRPGNTEVEFESIILTDRQLEEVAGFIDGIFTEPRGCGGSRIEHGEVEDFERILRRVL